MGGLAHAQIVVAITLPWTCIVHDPLISERGLNGGTELANLYGIYEQVDLGDGVEEMYRTYGWNKWWTAMPKVRAPPIVYILVSWFGDLLSYRRIFFTQQP